MRVLIALDGSAISNDVMAAVAPWLRASGAEAILLAVIEPEEYKATMDTQRLIEPEEVAGLPGDLIAGSPGGMVVPRMQSFEPRSRTVEDRTQAVQRAHAEHLDFLESMAARHLEGVEHQLRVETSRHPAEMIGRVAAEDPEIRLIAVGTHGRSGLTRLVLGSVAEAIVREASVPVLVVRQGAAAT